MYIKIAHANKVLYCVDGNWKAMQFVISGTEFNRDMSYFVEGPRDVKTIATPSTVRHFVDSAFDYMSVRSIVLNEGLEGLGKFQDGNYRSIFCRQIQYVALPSTLRTIGDRLFYERKELKCVTFREGSALRKIGEEAFCGCTSLRGISLPEGLELVGKKCFCMCGLEEIAIPNSVTALEAGAFCCCSDLRRAVF